jgi:hypothetical protein
MRIKLLLAGASSVLSLVVTQTAVAGESQDPKAAVTVAVIGDTPYGAEQFTKFPALVNHINADASVEKVIHVGDIKNGSSPCDTSYFTQIFDYFQAFSSPVIYTPGDNEWTDCHRAKAGKYNPLERLTEVRRIFYPVVGESLGKRKAQVFSQAQMPGYAEFVENVLWSESRVVFSTLHAVGSNNDLVPWFTDDPGDAFVDQPEPRLAEFERRRNASVAWIHQTFVRAFSERAAGVVIFMQADTWDGTPTDGFDIILQHLSILSLIFRKPVLLVQGDSHRYKVDKPFASGDAQHGIVYSVPNLTRLVVEGETASEWLKLEVNPRTPDVFSWQRMHI